MMANENCSTGTGLKKTGAVTVKRPSPGAWSRPEENELVALVRKGTSIDALAKKYKRSPRAVRLKLERLGLNLAATKLEVSGDLKIPKELPSLEEVLKIVAAAILKAAQPGLGKTELQRLDTSARAQRLDTIANLYKAYAAGLEQYVGYRKIEADIVEMKQKYAELVTKKAESSAPK